LQRVAIAVKPPIGAKLSKGFVARIRLRLKAGFGAQVPDRVPYARWRRAGPAIPDIAPQKRGAHPGYDPQLRAYGEAPSPDRFAKGEAVDLSQRGAVTEPAAAVVVSL
jgi:hypothetical protein